MYKSRKKSNDQRNQVIMALFLSVIMVASTLAIVLNQDSTTIKYNDYKFNPLQSGGYITEINDEQIFFNYLPENVQDFAIPGNFCSVMQNAGALNILFEPESTSIQFLDFIRLEFEDQMTQPIVSTLTESSNSYSLFSVSNCSQSSLSQPTIFFKESNTTSLSLATDSCLIAESSEQGFLLLKDRLLYCYYGIME